MKFTKLQIIAALLVATGLLLAILSATDLCSFNGCNDAHQYRLFGIPLSLVGTLYFCILGASMLLSARFSVFSRLEQLILASGAGSELMMIHLQKNVIQAWCPLCLGIAVVVFLLCIVAISRTVIESREVNKMTKGKLLSRFMLLLIAAVVGFTISFVGIRKPEAAGIDPSLGKQNSKIEVYIFSDWLCPICLKVEPELEKTLPQLGKMAKIFFIDKPVHQESMNLSLIHI